MKSSSKEECISTIKEYLRNEEYEKYAILLDGEWGSGKTYLYKRYLEGFIKSVNKKTIYISLYGLSSIKEVEEKIYLKILEQFFPENKKIKIIKKSGKFLIEGAKVIKNTINDLSPHPLPSFAKENVINFMKIIDSYNDVVLIFDDFERCNIKSNTILGYINSWVEHKKCQCIIIANQEEIANKLIYEKLEDKLSVVLQKYSLENPEKTDEIQIDKLMDVAKKIFKENNEYNLIKEKLIGTVIYYEPNLSEIYDNILKRKCISENSKDFLKNNKSRILDIFKTKNCCNIRILSKIISQFNRIINSLKIDLNKEDSDYKMVIRDILTDLTKANITNATDGKPEVVDIFEEIDSTTVLEKKERFSFIENLVKQGSLNEKLLDNEVKSFLEYIRENNSNPEDSINKLYYMHLMKEIDVRHELDNVIKKLQNNGYGVKLYPKIISLFVKADEIGIKDNYLDKVVMYMKKNIEVTKVKDVHLRDYDFFWGDNMIEYKDAMKRISDAIEKNR